MEDITATLEFFSLEFFKSDVRDKLDVSKNHTVKVEELLKREIEEFHCHHEKQMKGFSEEEKIQYAEYHGEEYMELANYIPSIQRKSELISICTILEYFLKDLCSLYKDKIQYPLEFNDINAHGDIDRARKYLIKVVGIPFPETSENWKEIVIIQQVRNAFVHHDGVTKLGSESVQYAKKSLFFDITELAYIDEKKKMARLEIKEGFTVHCIDVYKTFFEELFTVIK
jgi:hypothetical protein